MKISEILGQLNVLTANPSLVNVADEQKESICSHLLNALRVLVFSLASPPEMHLFILVPGIPERNEVLSNNPLRVQDDYLTSQPTHGRASVAIGKQHKDKKLSADEIELAGAKFSITAEQGNIFVSPFFRHTRFDSESAAMQYLTSHGYCEAQKGYETLNVWSKEGAKHTFRIQFHGAKQPYWTLQVVPPTPNKSRKFD